MAQSKKAFHFDLDVNKLKALYPSNKENGWKRAWSDIKRFMEGHGFEHVQYSGYESIKPMGYDKAYEIMHSMSEVYPWFCLCAQAASMTVVGERHDVLAFLSKEMLDEEPPSQNPVSLHEQAAEMRLSSQALESASTGRQQRDKHDKER